MAEQCTAVVVLIIPAHGKPTRTSRCVSIATVLASELIAWPLTVAGIRWLVVVRGIDEITEQTDTGIVADRSNASARTVLWTDEGAVIWIGANPWRRERRVQDQFDRKSRTHRNKRCREWNQRRRFLAGFALDSSVEFFSLLECPVANAMLELERILLEASLLLHSTLTNCDQAERQKHGSSETNIHCLFLTLRYVSAWRSQKVSFSLTCVCLTASSLIKEERKKKNECCSLEQNERKAMVRWRRLGVRPPPLLIEKTGVNSCVFFLRSRFQSIQLKKKKKSRREALRCDWARSISARAELISVVSRGWSTWFLYTSASDPRGASRRTPWCERCASDCCPPPERHSSEAIELICRRSPRLLCPSHWSPRSSCRSARDPPCGCRACRSRTAASSRRRRADGTRRSPARRCASASTADRTDWRWSGSTLVCWRSCDGECERRAPGWRPCPDRWRTTDRCSGSVRRRTSARSHEWSSRSPLRSDGFVSTRECEGILWCTQRWWTSSPRCPRLSPSEWCTDECSPGRCPCFAERRVRSSSTAVSRSADARWPERSCGSGRGMKRVLHWNRTREAREKTTDGTFAPRRHACGPERTFSSRCTSGTSSRDREYSSCRALARTCNTRRASSCTRESDPASERPCSPPPCSFAPLRRNIVCTPARSSARAVRCSQHID